MPSMTETPSALLSCRFSDSIFPFCCNVCFSHVVFGVVVVAVVIYSLIFSLSVSVALSDIMFVTSFTHSLLRRNTNTLSERRWYQWRQINEEKRNKELFTSVTLTERKIQTNSSGRALHCAIAVCIAICSSKWIKMNRKRQRDSVFAVAAINVRVWLLLLLLSLQLFRTKVNSFNLNCLN